MFFFVANIRIFTLTCSFGPRESKHRQAHQEDDEAVKEQELPREQRNTLASQRPFQRRDSPFRARIHQLRMAVQIEIIIALAHDKGRQRRQITIVSAFDVIPDQGAGATEGRRRGDVARGAASAFCPTNSKVRIYAEKRKRALTAAGMRIG